MGKGKNTSRRNMRRVNDPGAELRNIESIEKKLEDMKIKRETAKIVKNSLDLTDGESFTATTYTGCKVSPVYTSASVKEILDENDLSGVDMSSSLMCDTDVMFGLLAKHVEDEASNPILHYYIRTLENSHRFAMMQNVIERLMLGTHIPVVQGAIFHIGGTFYLVASDTCIKQSECIGVLKSLVGREQIVSNENHVVVS